MANKFDYLRMTKTAQRLISKFGKLRTITGYSDALPDPAKPNRPGVRTPVETIANCVFLDYEQKHIDGTLVKIGDMKVLVSPREATLPVNLTGTITSDDGLWSIVKLTTVNPGGHKLLYTIQVRK